MIIYPIILAGGAGVRLWPLSRADYPKQFLPLVGAETLLQQTIRRLDGLQEAARPIIVNPGAALSLQKHRQRAEHWVVVRGQAQVTRDQEVFLLAENQATDIPLGAIHRLENPADELLELIEVQFGDYLGEDDIERLEDRYQRDGQG